MLRNEGCRNLLQTCLYLLRLLSFFLGCWNYLCYLFTMQCNFTGGTICNSNKITLVWRDFQKLSRTVFRHDLENVKWTYYKEISCKKITGHALWTSHIINYMDFFWIRQSMTINLGLFKTKLQNDQVFLRMLSKQ